MIGDEFLEALDAAEAKAERDAFTGVVDSETANRLGRSLVVFIKLVEVFNASRVTFVPVTQSFNATTSMGAADAELPAQLCPIRARVIGERIRDKVAASRKRGMWMGSYTPLGYDVRERKLVVNDAEAALVRRIFQGFVEMESCTRLVQVLRAEGATTKLVRPLTKSDVYRILSNRVYLGEAVHKGTAYPGEHDVIVTRAQWDAVHAVLQISPRVRVNRTRNTTAPLLRGLIFDSDGRAMSGCCCPPSGCTTTPQSGGFPPCSRRAGMPRRRSRPSCASQVLGALHELLRGLHEAACHGCLLVAETSCEARNLFLDRALLVETVGTGNRAFFG